MTAQPIRVLVVDDEEGIRRPLADHLIASHHYQVDTAANSDEALRLLNQSQGHYDVVLIDQVLEGNLNGLDLMRSIKTSYPEVQVIVSTGWGMNEVEGIEILRQGAYRFFAKPFNIDELALTIRFAAEQRQIRREREYLSTLVQVSREFSQTTDIEKQLSLIWDYVREQLETPTFFIALYDSATDTLRFHQSYDEGELDPLPDRFLGSDPSHWGLAGYVAKTGQEQVWFSREQATKEWERLGLMPYVGRKGLNETGICLPLRVGEKILGILSLQSHDPQAFDRAFLNTVRTLASQVAPAIENARLFQEVVTTRDYLDRLIASSFDGIYAVDSLGIVVSFNSMAERITGYKAEDLLGKSVRGLYYDTEEPNVIGKLLQQSFDGKLADYETGMKSKRGDRIPIRLSGTWLFDAAGNRIGSVGYFQDLRYIQETEMQRQRLLQASKTIAQATSLEEGLQFLSKIMMESCIVTFCSILLLTPDERGFIVRAAYPIPRLERLNWDPGIGRVYLPFRSVGLAEALMTDKPMIFRQGKKAASKLLRHLTEEMKLPQPLHSILTVPLQTNKRRLGICILGEMRSWERSPITDGKVELAQSLTDQTAIFIEKMRLYELTQQRADLFEALGNLSLTVSSSLNLDEILNKTCQAAVELFEVDHSGIVIFDPDYVKGRIAAEYPPSTNMMGVEIGLRGVPIEEKIVQEREPIVIFDVQNEKLLGQVREVMYDQFNIQSAVFVPVISKGNILGSFSLEAIGNKRLFTLEEIELCKIFASHVASAMENARLYQDLYRHQQLLIALDESSRHIRAEKEPAKLLHEVVRLAAELVSSQVGGLAINHPHLEELEISVTLGFPLELIGSRLIYNEEAVGLVARIGRPRIVNEYAKSTNRDPNFETQGVQAIVGIPLKRRNEVEAVLFVADTTGSRQFTTTDMEILERFAAQASIVLQTSRLMSREQRMFARLAFLYRISDLMQDAKDLEKLLHVVLTSVTAGYGLGFNRAALFLLDHTSNTLIGRMGMGYLNEADAHRDWAHLYQYGLDDFKRYLERLERGNLPQTIVGEKIRGLLLPLETEDADVFARAVLVRHQILVTQAELDRLPARFIESFEPALPLIVAPLLVRDRAIGLLVADNKFTQSPITDEDLELLMTFVNSAAIAIDNAQLLQEVKVEREKIRASFESSTALTLSQPTAQLLENIIHQAQKATGASWVSVVLIDELGFARNLYTTESNNKLDIETAVRPDGITMQVMRTGRAVVIEDTKRQGNQINPGMFHDDGVAALCLPFDVQGKQIGVVWIHYQEPRHFPDYELEAIQLFVNQAAIAYDSARRMEELEHMRKATEAMTGALDSSQVLQQIVESAREVLQADSTAIWSYDNVRNQFIPEELVASGIPPDVLERFRKNEPKKGGTTDTLLEQGWIGITDAFDPRFDFMGLSTKELLTSIGTQSFQGIALIVGYEKLGVLYANYNHPRGFTTEDRRTLETFANHAALTLKKSRLLEQIGKARDSARVVAQVTALGNRKATLLSVAQGTKETLGCDAVTLYVYEQTTNKLAYPPVMVGVKTPEIVARLAEVTSDSIVYEMLQLDDLYIVPIVAEDTLFKDRRFARDEMIESCVAIPLKAGAQKVGVMFVNYRSRHHFTDDELTNIQLFANQAAVAIQNAQQFEALKELDRKKTEFLSTVSHEIRTPLTPVQSCIENLLSGMYGFLNEKQRSRLEIALTGVREESRLVENLLDLARIQEGKTTLDLTHGDILGIIHDVVGVFRYDASQKAITITEEIPAEERIEMVIDAGKIKQVITNLISNALKFTPERGAITISVRCSDKQVEVQVKDSGIGIPETEFQKIFDRFYQVDSSLTRKVGGTGIGLNIAKEYVEMHGGRIWVESSELGEGSTFMFTLPIR